MANLSSLEKRQFEDLFGMESGYVMDFSNNSFGEFFRNTANVNIYDSKYGLNSGSKANRMRAFWEKESDALVGKILNEMLAVWEYENDNAEGNKTYKACCKIADRLTGKKIDAANSEEDFLEKDFGSLSFDKLPIEAAMVPIMQSRYKEAYSGLKNNNAPLSVIFLCGSMLEGILLGAALKNATGFTNAACAPKDKQGKALPLQSWKLGNLIDAACQLKLLGQDIKKFSHALRDFRNYIHPYEQMSSQFNPDQHTAKICMQVLRAAVANLSGERKN